MRTRITITFVSILSILGIALLLLRGPADPFRLARDGDTGRLSRLISNEPEVVFLEDDTGKTPLFYAGNKEVAELLLQNGADPCAHDIMADTPLHYARTAAISSLLLNSGAEDCLNEAGASGYTPLHVAVNGYSYFETKPSPSERIKIIEVLLDHGADINKMSLYKTTPLDDCADANIALLLISRGAIHVKRDGSAYRNDPNWPKDKRN